MRIRRCLVAFLLGGAAIACGRHEPEAANAILISIDTLRADALGCAGNPRAETPNLDGLSRDGVMFENVVSPAPLTLPAHGTLFTGTIPPRHGVRDNFLHRLPPSRVTLAETLRESGFETAAFVSAFVLDRRFGVDQGFDTYEDRIIARRGIPSAAERPCEETVQLAVRWLEEHAGQPFFLFVHLYEPHEPYEPPEPYATRFGDHPYLGEVACADGCVGQLLDAVRDLGVEDSTAVAVVGDHGEMLGEHGELAHSYFIYRSAVRVPLLLRLPVRPAVTRVDSLVGLVDVMPTLCGLLGAPIPTTTQGMDLSPLMRGDETDARRTLYCESLTPTRYGADALHGVVGERWKYIRSLRPELYRTVEDPGEENNVLSQNPEVVEDMTAALAAALNEAPAASEESRIVLDPDAVKRLRALGYVEPADLSPSDAGDRVDAKDLIDVHEAHRRAMWLISKKEFDEAEPLARAVVNKLPDFWMACSNLAKVTVGQKRWREAVPLLHRADELRHGQYEILADLGLAYTELGELDRATESFRRAVPFDPAPPLAELNLARALFNQGKPEEAEPHLANIARLAEEKGNLLVPLSRLLRDHGRLEEAAGHLREALRRQPGNVQARIDLAELLLRQRREQEAAEQIDVVLRTAGDDEAVLARLGKMLSRLGRFDLAGRYLAGKSGGDRAAAHRNAGMALIEQGHLEGARAELEAAVALDPRDVESHNGLGVVLASSGDLQGAQKAFERVLELDPDYAGAYLNLGMVALDAGQPLATAAAHFERAAKVDPSLAEAHFNLALARIRQGRHDEAVAGLRKTLELAPDSPQALNHLAWLYATAADPGARDPAEAVRLALQACALTRYNDPYSLEALAVAYSASGDQARARETTRRALELATLQGHTQLAEELEERLQEHGG